MGRDHATPRTLRHLDMEAMETQAAPDDTEEYTDCFLQKLDAARRAGIFLLQFIEAAQRMLVVNRQCTGARPVDDQPVEHLR